MRYSRKDPYEQYRNGEITESELDQAEVHMELFRAWRRQLPKFNALNLSEMFPEMKPKIKRALKLTVHDETLPYKQRERASRDLRAVDDPNTVTDSMKERAREADVPAMFGLRNRAQRACLWCSSSDAFTIYPHAVKCYSCGKWADAISVYQELNKVGFITAVKSLQ